MIFGFAALDLLLVAGTVVTVAGRFDLHRLPAELLPYVTLFGRALLETLACVAPAQPSPRSGLSAATGLGQ